MFAAAPEAAFAEDPMTDNMLDPHAALIYIMVMVSAADREMSDDELRAIGDVIHTFPAFRGFDDKELIPIAQDCAKRMGQPDGVERVLDLIVASLPDRLGETAYFIACDIAASKPRLSQPTLQMLEILRNRLRVGRLPAAAIERGVRARRGTL
jgi:tellurite resistance protein